MSQKIYDSYVLMTCGDIDRAFKSPFGWPERKILLETDRVSRFEGGKIKGLLMLDKSITVNDYEKPNQLQLVKGSEEWLIQFQTTDEKSRWKAQILRAGGVSQPLPVPLTTKLRPYILKYGLMLLACYIALLVGVFIAGKL